MVLVTKDGFVGRLGDVLLKYLSIENKRFYSVTFRLDHPVVHAYLFLFQPTFFLILSVIEILLALEAMDGAMDTDSTSGGNCIKIGHPGKSILRDYFQENRTSRRPFLLVRISFPRKPILHNWSLKTMKMLRST